MASLPYPRTPTYPLMVSAVGAVLARLVHFQGVQQSLLHGFHRCSQIFRLRGWYTSRGCSSLCCTNKVNGAVPSLLVHLRQVHPLKKIPTEANLRWDFHLYVFSDIYLTSTFLDVPSLILTTLMPF